MESKLGPSLKIFQTSNIGMLTIDYPLIGN